MRPRYALVLMAMILVLTLLLTPQVLAQTVSLEIEVTQQSYLIFDGDRLPLTVSLTNVSPDLLEGIVVHSTTGAEKTVGALASGATQNITLYIDNYNLGNNEVDIYANYSGGGTVHKYISFEVRPSDESITLSVINAPQSIYEGEDYTAQLQVQNLWQNTAYGVRIKNADEVLYNVGALNPHQSLNINLQVSNYHIGNNSLQLVVEDERASAPPVPLQFEVIPADSAVKVYLASLDKATYPTETLKFSLAVVASQVAGVSDLEIKAMTDGIQPSGYFLGAQTSQQTNTLAFTMQNADLGTQPLTFQVSYRIGNVSIQRTFTVDAHLVNSPSVLLIQAQRIVAKKGEEATVILHVANDLPVQIDGVRVIPLGNIDIAPAEFFIGSMNANDFLAASFKVETSNLNDGDQLSFKVVYTIDTQTYETQPVNAVVHLEPAKSTNYVVLIIVVLVVVALLVIILLRFMRRKK